MYVPYLIQGWIEDKRLIKELLTSDTKHLIDNYNDNSIALSKLFNNEIDHENAQEQIRMTFHRGDLILDGTNAQLRKANLFGFSLIEVTTPYYKHLTDNSFYENEFSIE